MGVKAQAWSDRCQEESGSCVFTPTSSLSWWCSDCGSSQRCSDPVGAGFAATFWVIRTQQRSGAPAQTPEQLWSSWN